MPQTSTYNTTTGQLSLSPMMEKLKAEKKAAFELQKRRHPDWTETYDLYRNKVITNRLTQRQAVNIPLMKETIKTMLSKIDDAPNIEWVELGGDQEKEIIYQEVWDDNFRQKKFELIDILDKKNVLIYGIGNKFLNLVDDGITIDALDPFDVLYDPLMKPGQIETARYFIRQNIFRSVREILADESYDADAKKELNMWLESPPGITQSQTNRLEWEAKMKRIKDMGVQDSQFAYYAGGERIINLSEHFTEIWDSGQKKFVRHVVTYADDSIELSKRTLKEAIGVEFWPSVVWSEDPESQDVYADSIGDLVRTPNKVLNVWYSQLIENRTLKNFQMHWYLPVQGYTAQTYQPGPGVMLPAPPGEDINKVIQPVAIDGLDDTLLAINAITQIVERGSGATAIEKGQGEKGTQTLGEIQVLVGKAQERTVSIAKFYKMSWYELAWKWDKLMQANGPKFLKLYKKSRSGKIYPKRVYAGDWKSKAGYEPLVRSSSEQEQEQLKTVQKFQFVLSQFPNNPALRKIAQRRELEMLKLTPEELKQVEDAEDQMIANAAGAPQGETAAQPDLQGQIKAQMAQLGMPQ